MSRLLSVVVVLLLAACTQLPEKPAPPKPPAAERAQYVATSFAALPGWERTRLEPSLRAFLSGNFLNKNESRLVALEPYTPGLIPVVFVHGTASVAARWADMVNDLNGVGGAGRG